MSQVGPHLSFLKTFEDISRNIRIRNKLLVFFVCCVTLFVNAYTFKDNINHNKTINTNQNSVLVNTYYYANDTRLCIALFMVYVKVGLRFNNSK